VSAAQTPDEVRRRLKKRADELGMDMQSAVQFYAMERFLFRLSKSQWADKLVVKGAAMLRVWDAAIARPTRDIDFLGRVPNTPDELQALVAECLAIKADDGLIFSDEIEATAITVEDRYPGARIKVAGNLSGARFVLRLDVGIDDAAIPEPGWADYPTLIGDPAPRILVYHPATAIAEKLQAIVEIGLANSRLKDYYDVWMLARRMEFDGTDVAKAFSATFSRRETALPTELPVGLTAQFTEQPDTVAMWFRYRNQLAKAGIEAPENLREVAEEIAEFVMPPLMALEEGVEFELTWAQGGGWR